MIRQTDGFVTVTSMPSQHRHVSRRFPAARGPHSVPLCALSQWESRVVTKMLLVVMATFPLDCSALSLPLDMSLLINLMSISFLHYM